MKNRVGSINPVITLVIAAKLERTKYVTAESVT